MLTTTTKGMMATRHWLPDGPCSFQAGDANLYRYVGNDPTNAVDPSGAYQTDVHYGMTYLIALAVGIPATPAYQIAAANQYTDDQPQTSPMPFTGDYKRDVRFIEGVRIRWLYHFRTSTITGTVTRDSKEANQIINIAMRQSPQTLTDQVVNNFLMGIGLHAFQDSWSHEGYGPWIGHALYKDNVFKDNNTPDLPYATKENYDKAIEMALATYDKLDAYRQAFYADGKPLLTKDQVKAIAVELMKKENTEDNRLDSWLKAIQQSMKINPIPYLPRSRMNAHDLALIEGHFLRAAQMVPLPGDSGWVLTAQDRLKKWIESGKKTWEGFWDDNE
jgi:hypothetical protein